MDDARHTHGEPAIRVEDLSVGYGTRTIQSGLSFSVRRGDVFVVMGGSGCGKSTLLRVLYGLLPPLSGRVLHGDVDFWSADAERQDALRRTFGVLFQAGALWSSLTLAENVGLPLAEYTELGPAEIQDVVRLKLALVGLAGYEQYYPSEISGGMRKRAGLARAMALDPEVLFFDEPSAGLDPLSSRRLDDLMLELRDSLGTTVVVVTHELQSIFAIADDCVFLDAETHTMIANGDPRRLRTESPDERVREFLNRGETEQEGAA